MSMRAIFLRFTRDGWLEHPPIDVRIIHSWYEQLVCSQKAPGSKGHMEIPVKLNPPSRRHLQPSERPR